MSNIPAILDRNYVRNCKECVKNQKKSAESKYSLINYLILSHNFTSNFFTQAIYQFFPYNLKIAIFSNRIDKKMLIKIYHYKQRIFLYYLLLP